MARTVPVIDLFAGPGGLSEGFHCFGRAGQQPFHIRLSIEKEARPHKTLELRAFFRHFENGKVPEDYYEYLRGHIARSALFENYPGAAIQAQKEAWHAELGKTPHQEVMTRIGQVLRPECRRWVLIGGPPCQAYSVAGRSRMRHDENFANDARHFLYREYLRIIAERQPAVFVMENVLGILSSKAEQEGIFERILRDLKNPREALALPGTDDLEYHLYPLADDSDDREQLTLEDSLRDPHSFIVRAERYGIPQARPRVFILGVRADIRWVPNTLTPTVTPRTVWQAIGDLPPLRSCISKGNGYPKDSPEAWRSEIQNILTEDWFCTANIPPDVRRHLTSLAGQLSAEPFVGGNWVAQAANPLIERDWYHDERLGGVPNHESRSHMPSDLRRYFFATVFSELRNRSPLLKHFPQELRPEHKNVEEALKGDELFSDRFRVQMWDRPSTTVVSHISKDGHYYIHPDPMQCRSLTVREAARLQTFPDNYFFEGPRTGQYHQVGNAVPPLLASQIAAIVYEIIR